MTRSLVPIAKQPQLGRDVMAFLNGERAAPPEPTTRRWIDNLRRLAVVTLVTDF